MPISPADVSNIDVIDMGEISMKPPAAKITTLEPATTESAACKAAAAKASTEMIDEERPLLLFSIFYFWQVTQERLARLGNVVNQQLRWQSYISISTSSKYLSMLSIIHACPTGQGQLNAKITFYSIVHGPD